MDANDEIDRDLMDRKLTVKEFAAMFNVSYNTVRKWLKNDSIRGKHVDGKIAIPISEARKHWRSMKSTNAKP